MRFKRTRVYSAELFSSGAWGIRGTVWLGDRWGHWFRETTYANRSLARMEADRFESARLK